MIRETVSMRKCRVCGVEKPLTTEHFRPSKKKWFMYECNPCRNERRRAEHAANPTPQRAASKRRRERVGERIREQKRVAYVRAMQSPEFVEKERERNRIRTGEKRRQDPHSAREAAARHRANNRERVREVRAQGMRAARLRDPLKFKVRNAETRARRKSVEGSFSKQDVLAAFDKQGGQCLYCDGVVNLDDSISWHADHFIPLSRGGTNHPENIVVACAACNLQKHAQMPWEFKPDRFSPPQPQAAD